MKLLILIAYFIVLITIGFVCRQKATDVNGFVLGGRSVGPWLTAFAYGTSYFSAVVFVGYAGQFGWRFGIAATWAGIGNALIGSLLAWVILGRRTRIMTQHLDSATMPQFFGERFQSKSLKIAASVIIFIFLIPYTASLYNGLSRLFGMAFHIDYSVCIVLMAILTAIYVIAGGYMATAINDFIQGIIMSIALLIVFVFGVNVAGGFDAVAEHAKSLPGYLTMFTTYDPVSGTEQPYPILNVLSMLAWGLGYFGMPHVLLRFMAIEDEEKLTLSRRVATTWVVISLAVAVTIGVVGLGMTTAGELPVLEGSNSETIIVQIANLLSQHGVIPALLAGIILAGILASTMSTADSQLLAASSSVSSDLLGSVLKKASGKKSTMFADRVTVLLIAVIAVFMARDPSSSVFNIVSFAWAGFGAVFGPVVLFALFWKRSNWQ